MTDESRCLRGEPRDSAAADAAGQGRPLPLRVVESRDTPSSELRGVSRGRALLEIQDLFCKVADIDPDTAGAVPVPAGELLWRVAEWLRVAPIRKKEPIDASLLVAAWAAESIARIVKEPRLRMRRQHAVSGLAKVREIDARGLRWLTQRPGATVREKLAHTRRMLGVVRPWVPDTHENRVVCRVIADVRSIFARRSASLCPRGVGGALAAGQIEAAIDVLRHACREEFERSPLAGVKPATNFAPNNVLLGDHDYKRVWKLAGWLRALEEHFAALWSRGDEALAAALMLAIESLLWQRADTHLVGHWLKVTPGGSAACSFDDLTGKRWWLCELHDSEGMTIGLGRSGARLEIMFGPVSSSGPRSEAIGHASAQVEFLEDDPDSSVGSRFTCTLAAGARIERSPPFVVSQGLAECAAWVVERLGFVGSARGPRPRLMSTWMRPSGIKPAAGQHAALGADLFGAGVRIAAPDGDGVEVCGPAAAARWTLEGVERWMAGDEAARAPRGNDACSFYAIGRLLNFKNDDLLREGALRAVFGMVASHALPVAEWAVAIPDEFDELDCQVVRAALPATAGVTTLVWRSVAAALRWTTTSATVGFEEGEQLVIVDGEASCLGPVPLMARYEDNDRTAVERLYWERASVAEPLASGKKATAAAWLEERARVAVAGGGGEQRQSVGSVADGDLNGVVARDMCDRDLWEAGACSWIQEATAEQPPVWHRVHCRATDEAFADRAFIDGFADWLRVWSESPGRTSLDERAGGKRVQWHFVGRPFDRPAIQMAVAHALPDYDPGWSCSFASDPLNEVAAGAAEYIARRSRGLPTWVDIVPDLYFLFGDQEIQLFRRRSVRPGEPVREPSTRAFKLPRGQQAYRLPLLRDKNRDKPLAFVARIESDRHFPLAEDVFVTAHVSYRHAVDGFHIRFVPSQKAPFETLDVVWARAGESGRGGERKLDNSEPAYPPVIPWGNVSQQEVDAVTKAIDEFARVCNSVFTPENGRLVQQQRQTDDVVKEMKRCIQAADGLDKAARAVWVNGREEAPNAVLQKRLAEKLFPWCARLLKTNELGCVAADIPKSFLGSGNQQYQDQANRLKASLRTILSLLRDDVPEPWAAVEYDYVRSLSTPGDEDLYRLGRLLDGRRPGDGERLVEWLVERLKTACDKADGKKRIHACVWCLAHALFYRRRLRGSLSGALCEEVLEVCEAVVSLVASDAQGPRWRRDECFAETCMVFFSLLRRRGLEDGELYRAGGARMTRIAADLESAARKTADSKTRYSVERGTPATPSQLAALVCEALRGERVAVIEPCEDT